MKILAFDTTMRACSVALMDTRDPTQCCNIFEVPEKGHAEILLPMINHVIGRAGISYSDLDLVAVTAGPGAFTGVRIGVATARGLSLSLGVKVAGFSSLHVLAFEAVNKHRLSGEFDIDRIVVVTRGGRGDLYQQIFDQYANPLSNPTSINPAEFIAPESEKQVVVVGNGGQILKEQAEEQPNRVIFLLPDLLPNASHLCELAVNFNHSSGIPSPLYLRPPDAVPQDNKRLSRTYS